MKRLIATGLALASLSACAISQKVEPAHLAAKSICVVKNPQVRDTFGDAIVGSLIKRGYDAKIAMDDKQAAACPSRLMYTANWTWDMAMYMRRAELVVFEGDKMAGRATYDASGGGYRMDKFVDAGVKVDELVGQLFPAS